MKRLFLLFLIFILLGGIGYYFVAQRSAGGEVPQNNTDINTLTAETPTSEPKDVSLPKKLVIPSLDISAEIEHVGMDEKGNMDVPEKNENVAWFELGYPPGAPGNAVIAGHLDTKSGAPAVFYNLDDLKKGDTIQVVQDDGSIIEFTVVAKETYPAAEFPLNYVFGPSTKSKLNLITCQGGFTSSKGYSHRTVIFSELSS